MSKIGRGARRGSKPEEAGREDALKGAARETWGSVKDTGNAPVNKAKAARYDAEIKSASAEAFDREHDESKA